MANLIVTSAALDDSAEKLSSIKTEFDGADRRATTDADVWGASPVEAAMEKFGTDWSIHRGHISTAIGDLHKKLEDMSTAWNNTEQGLSDSLTTESV
ncbi:hypothetical protein E3T61_17175 [Cryobacterium lactosi]|uniref:Uncharacterized protein n=1 Tax=Cryobacterium lactosi TaxID=1259202 RepID=A0A4R9BK88_9MICO|nr:hypothetical protein [Cryobacterium lactosi]TFD85856.1 hypothetical protein E3T61_17175 [Cryobacterium lactosi]